MMTGPPLSRRGMLGLTAAGAAATALPGAARAGLGPPVDDQAGGFYRFTLGEFEMTVVSDGNLRTPVSTLGVNAGAGEVAAFLDSRHLPTDANYAHTNHVVIAADDAAVLVDVGSGDKFQQSAGRLVENMEAAEIAVDDITHVALTHAHPDHVWGMMDDFGDDPRFPDAAYAIGAREFDWWMDDGRIAAVPEVMQAFVVGAQNALRPVADRTEMVRDGHSVIPGVTMIDTNGHTEGHMSVMVESGGARLLIASDTLTHAHISFERPDWQFGFDTDRDAAAATRMRLLDMLATDRIPVLGYHLPFPGIGHVVRDGTAYRFLPALWRWSE